MARSRKALQPCSAHRIKRQVVIDDPDPDHISTNFAERQNLGVRMSDRGVTPGKMRSVRKVENHAAVIALCYFAYNFIKIHRKLPHAACDGARCGWSAVGSVGPGGPPRSLRAKGRKSGLGCNGGTVFLRFLFVAPGPIGLFMGAHFCSDPQLESLDVATLSFAWLITGPVFPIALGRYYTGLRVAIMIANPLVMLLCFRCCISAQVKSPRAAG